MFDQEDKVEGCLTVSSKAQDGISKCEMMPGKRSQCHVMLKIQTRLRSNTLKHFKTKHKDVNKTTHDLIGQNVLWLH